MKTKQLLAAIASLLFSLNVPAQKFAGKVTDENHLPISYATVAVLSSTDSTLIQGCVTDNEGMFQLDVTENREYILRVSCIGYKNHTMKSAPMDLGIIAIAPSEATVIGELVVKGNTPAYRKTANGISTVVSNTVLSKAGTGYDVIGHLPGIRKKADGTYEVIGKGTPLIYINNREVRDLSELERLPSDEIRQLDLILSPGAEYKASAGTIIKIKTTSNKREGVSLGITSSAERSYKTNTTQQTNWAYKHGGIELSGALRYELSHSKENAITYTETHTDTVWTQKALSIDKFKRQSIFGQIGLSYDINPQHSLGIMYEITSVPTLSTNNHTLTDVYADGSAFDVWRTSDIAEERNGPSHHANVYYKGTCRKLSVEVNADMLTGRNSGREYVKDYSERHEDIMTTTEEYTRNRLYAGKIIFSYPLGNGQLSAGSEYTHAIRQAGSSGYGDIVESSDDKITDRNVAIFIGYNGSIGKIGAEAGVRYEHVTYEFYENSVCRTDESKQYNNLFPTLSVNIPLKNSHLTLGYYIKTERPAYNMLKSAVHYGNRLTYLSGTPGLQPTYKQSVELAWQYRSLLVSAGFNHLKDDIIFATEPYDNDPKISIIKFSNISSRNELVFSAAIAPTIGLWKPQWMLSGETQWFDVRHLDMRKSMNGTTLHIKWDNAISLPKDLLLRIDMGLDSRGFNKNQRVKSSGFMNISISKDLAKGKWNIMMEGNDLFHTMRSASWQYDLQSMEYRKTEGNTQQIKLTVRYKFNERQNTYKGSGAGTSEMQRF